MEVREVIKKLEKSPEFKNWRKKDKESYLSNAFLILEEKNWSVGYYSRKRNRITSFEVNGSIKIKPYEKIFSTGDEVKKLLLEKVKIEFQKALDIANSFRNKEYPSEGSVKTIVVLQNLPLGQVWNITYLTSSFSTINIKVDTLDGKVLNHSLTSLFRFDSGSKN